MKKRTLSMALALCLALSLAVPAYAADNSVASTMEKDYAAMSAVFIDLEQVFVYSTEGGIITYAYQISDQYTDYITVQHNNDGSAILNIREGDCYNTMTVAANGTIYIDGEEVTSDNVSSTAPPTITPRVAFSYIYRTTPFANTTASQYNVGTYYQNCSDIGLAQSIRTVTATVLGTLLAAKFFPGNATMQQAATTVCRGIANQLKAKGETIAGTINAISYKMRIDGHPNNDSFNFYRKYTGTYYFGKNYSGTVYRAAPFYEARITQS